MKKVVCPHCSEERGKNHVKKCCLNPANVSIMLNTYARQMFTQKSSILFSPYRRPIDAVMRLLKRETFSFLLRKLSIDDLTEEQQIIEVVRYAVEKGISVDSFPPPCRYVLDGFHCMPKKQFEEKLAKAFAIENLLIERMKHASIQS